MIETRIVNVVPRVTEGVEFSDESNSGFFEALEACSTARLHPLYTPELALTRLYSGDFSIWHRGWRSPSLVIAGKTRGNNSVVVYVHQETTLSELETIRRATCLEDSGWCLFPRDEFHNLLDQEGNGRVFVVDYSNLTSWPSGLYGIEKPTDKHIEQHNGKIGGLDMVARNHPQTAPFLAIGDDRISRYMDKHTYSFRQSKIGIWISRNADNLEPFRLEDNPMFKMLYVGSWGDTSLGGLAIVTSKGGGRILGVRPRVYSSLLKETSRGFS